MARQISVEVSELVKDLIIQVTGYQGGSESFNRVQKYFHEKLRKSDTMYFLNKTEVDKIMAGMAEKFNFHGFFSQSEALIEAYNNYITKNVPEYHLTSRLNVVKFLLCMSEKPTSKFLENPHEFQIQPQEKDEEINWSEYLMEGIEYSIPKIDESSDCSEISSITDDRYTPDYFEDNKTAPLVTITSCEKDVVMNLRANREELYNTIQHTWYNDTNFQDKPFSERREANIGMLWEKHLENQAMGLVVLKKSTVLSEYKVLREILWQLWETHTSTVFYFDGNIIKIRDNVTISSLRAGSFKNFLENQVVPYIHLLEFFRDFDKLFDIKNEECVTTVSQTYRSYNNSLQNLIRPLYLKLSQLEDKVREQETIYTLLNLSEDLEHFFEPIKLLKTIHDYVVIDFEKNQNIISATSLLTRLHDSLQFSTNKLDQDLRVTLYIESLYYYLNVVHSWFVKNDFNDYSNEFLITKSTDTGCDLNFVISDEICISDGLLKIMSTLVLKIGKNVHLLRLLKDFSLVNDREETIYEEFVRRVLEELCRLFNSDEKIFIDENFETTEEISYKFPVISSDDCSKPTEMDKLDNLVDTTDGFLMLAFEDYFKYDKEEVEPKKRSLFEKISSITKTFFPVSNFFEKIFCGILKERFTVSGLKVKNILMEEYLLEKEFRFMRHIFLFFDNLLFPFYRRFFMEVYAQNKNWGNDIWLTSHLQDIIMDIYPEFYEKCSVQIDENWKVCNDALEACNMISLQLDIPWPLNLIIIPSQIDMYKDVFHFILKIKWGLYTLNNLSFTDLEPRRQKDRINFKSHKSTIMKLKYLRFAFNNLLNSIHHYIFSFIFTKCLQKFELDFEEANDLSSIISSHADFINSSNRMVNEVKECGQIDRPFDSVTTCIKILKYMWENPLYATPERLYDIYKNYKRTFNIINPIISPTCLFDY
ncbi:gamma-tubulin complex component 5 [Diorhabda carinulata]|uniref:gamma-tubulin complex component 5 n=1 Tax=Diorhabda carinulata TaxID=1163345 RepID=UPI0025A0EA06|nr:gamma-tubulin complex component 5 [Diorhabda carinulata]